MWDNKTIKVGKQKGRFKMEKKYDVVLIKRFGVDGLTKENITELMGKTAHNQLYPIELYADYSECSAMGFITAKAAEKIGYDYAELESYIGGILDDSARVNDQSEYDFDGLSIYIG